MISPSSNFSSAILISFLLTLLHFLSLSPTSKATPTYSDILCPNSSTYSPNSTYKTNLNALFSVLSSNSTMSDGFYNFAAGRGTPDVAYGLFLCRGDVSAAVCRDCVDCAARDVVELCPRSKWATIWYDECMLRYSDTSIISTMDFTLSVMLPGRENVTEQSGRFNESLRELMGELATRDSLKTQLGDKKFATGEVKLTANQTLYGLLQCTPDITSGDCSICITMAVPNLPYCCYGKQGGRVLYTSCNVRYETYQFYSLDASATPQSPPRPPLPPPPPPPLPLLCNTAVPTAAASSSTTASTSASAASTSASAASPYSPYYSPYFRKGGNLMASTCWCYCPNWCHRILFPL